MPSSKRNSRVNCSQVNDGYFKGKRFTHVVIPRLVPHMLRLRITFKQLVEPVIRLADICDLFECRDTVLREPSNSVVTQHRGALLAFQIGTPLIEYLLEKTVDLRVLVDGKSGGCAHSPVQDGVNRYTDQADRMSSVCPCRRSGDNVIEYGKHVVKVPNLFILSRGIGEVFFAFRDLNAMMSQGGMQRV